LFTVKILVVALIIILIVAIGRFTECKKNVKNILMVRKKVRGNFILMIFSSLLIVILIIWNNLIAKFLLVGGKYLTFNLLFLKKGKAQILNLFDFHLTS